MNCSNKFNRTVNLNKKLVAEVETKCHKLNRSKSLSGISVKQKLNQNTGQPELLTPEQKPNINESYRTYLGKAR